MLTQSSLKELLHYDPDTGVFTWRVSRNGIYASGRAGGICYSGYRYICIDGRRYVAHRLAWLYVHGEWPKDQIDHINGVRDDNRIVNLREATHAENQQNVARRADNTSGFPGVHWHSRYRKWVAGIRCGGKRQHLGYFDDAKLAQAAYIAAKAELHKFQPALRKDVRARQREIPGLGVV